MSNLGRTIKEQIIKRDGGKCNFCGATDDLTIDHIVPRSKGGGNFHTNLRTLCRACHDEITPRWTPGYGYITPRERRRRENGSSE
jgi:5-methylcytosine-specific restriction endonuclease McrA